VTKTRTPNGLAKQLRSRQERHAELLRKVEKTTARLERRRMKLHMLESEIADLERRLARPNERRDGAAAIADVSREAILIFNPAAGPDKQDRAARLSQIVSSLRGHGIHVQIGLKTSGRTARALAREAVRERRPLVVVAGGDGTIEEVTSQLVGRDTVLGIIPCGTMNNLARSLGVPMDIEDACALIAMHTVRHIDVGRVFSNDRPHVEYFLEGAGVGLTAIAAATGTALEKRHWRFVPRGLRKLFDTKPGTIRVAMDGTEVEASSSMVTVSNAPLMGNNLLVAPGARMDDGVLDVRVYDGMGHAELLRHFVAASKGETDEIAVWRARHVRIAADVPLPTNSDSDLAPTRRVVEIEIVPKALAVIAGNGIGLTVPVEAAPPPPPLSGPPPKSDRPTEAELRMEPPVPANALGS